MNKIKKSFISFFFIFLLVFSFVIQAAEEDDWDITPTASLLEIPTSIAQAPAGDKNLESLFSPLVNRVPVQPPIKRIIAGVSSLLPAFPSFQVGVPLGVTGLMNLGVTKEIIPDSGVPSILLALGMLATPLTVGSMAAYEFVLKKLETQEPTVLSAQKTTTERAHSWGESFTYSYVTQTIQMALLGGLFFSFILDMESHVSGWGNPLIWGCVFGCLFLPVIYSLFVDSTNNSNRGLFRSFTNKEEETEQEACLQPIIETEEFIKNNQLTSPVKDLGRTLMVIKTQLPTSDIQQVSNENTPILYEPSLTTNNIRQTQSELQLINANQAKYLIALKQMGFIQSSLPPYQRSWNLWSSKLAKWGSLALQTAGLPMKGIISYALLEKISILCGLSPEASLGVSVGITIVAAPFLALSSLKEAPLTYEELKQLFHFYQPKNGCNFWGQRIAPYYARLAALIYFALPITNYLKTEILAKSLSITDLGAQNFLVGSFAAATLLPASAQFFDYYLTNLSNWVATWPCFDSNNERKVALTILKRVRRFKDTVRNLDPGYTSILHQELFTEPSVSVSSQENL